MSDSCLFCRIASGGIPADIVAESGDLMAFRDVAPQAPVHVLVIPRVHHPNIAALAQADEQILGALVSFAAHTADELGLSGGYRLVANTGPEAGQSVDHVHIHILGGRQLQWPPG